MDDSFDNAYELVPKLPSEKVFCMIFSYAWHYHSAVATFSQLSIEALKFLEKGACNQLEELCYKDPDFVQMFRLMGTLRSLGFRSEKARFDIEFPTRNHLKVFLTRLIMKRRKQRDSGYVDHVSSFNNTMIISSTDNCEGNIISNSCKNMFSQLESEMDHPDSARARFATHKSGFSNSLSGAQGFRGMQRRKSQADEEVKFDQEVVISTWINEVDFSLKSYDIVSMLRHPENQQCSSIHNELFHIDPETEKLGLVQNPKLRHKRLTCLIPRPTEKEPRRMEEIGTIRAKLYASDHRDTRIEKKIPNGYKIIGVKGFRNNFEDTVLHVADFLIWKPLPGWLEINSDENKSGWLSNHHTQKHGNRMHDQSWLSKPKNFIKMNNEKIKMQQMAFAQTREHQMHEVQRRSLMSNGLFHVSNKIVIRNKPKVTANSFYPAQGHKLFNPVPRSAAVGNRPRKVKLRPQQARELSPTNFTQFASSPKLSMPFEFKSIASNSVPTMQQVRTRSRQKGILKLPNRMVWSPANKTAMGGNMTSNQSRPMLNSFNETGGTRSSVNLIVTHNIRKQQPSENSRPVIRQVKSQGVLPPLRY